MQRKSTKNISQQQSTWEIFGTSKKDLGASTSLISDFRARICLLLENAGALKVAEAVYSLKRRGLFASITPLFLSLRTYPGFLPVTKDKTLKSYCERLPTLGFMSVNGNCLILPGFCPKIESGFTLSDILEKEVDKKYFLSPNVAKRILSYQPSRHDIGGGRQTEAICVKSRHKEPIKGQESMTQAEQAKHSLPSGGGEAQRQVFTQSSHRTGQKKDKMAEE